MPPLRDRGQPRHPSARRKDWYPICWEGVFPHAKENAVSILVRLPAVLLALCLAAPSQAQSQASPPQTGQLPNFVQLTERHGPAVVNISASRTVTPDGAGVAEGDPFYEFFRRFGQIPEQGERQEFGLGSGFIIRQDGYILTNAHVVAEADEVQVKLTDKREFSAKVLGTDTYTDVALLKIEANGLPTVQIGNPNALKPGEWVAAIGAPFGFENSVTSGIVSAKGRMLPDESYVPFIQTDVAVNPGNSGGPLFDMQGQVIGINSLIYSRTGGYMGLSFAIPIDIAMDVAEQLRATGRVTRSRIGVQVQELTRELAASFGLDKPQGALVAMVEEGGPAAKAGLRAGDILLSLNNQPIDSAADLARLVAQVKPGTTLQAEVWRKGQRVPMKIVTTELKAPEQEQAAAGEGGGGGGAATASVGLKVAPIPDEQRAALKLDHGIVVQNASGAALRAGIQPGDLILRVDDNQVKNVSEFESLLAKKTGGNAALLVRRGQNTLFVPLRVPKTGG